MKLLEFLLVFLGILVGVGGLLGYQLLLRHGRLLLRLEALERGLAERTAGEPSSTGSKSVYLPGPRSAQQGNCDQVPSLFIVSLPSSFSSPTYSFAQFALQLRQPSFTPSGEILNFDKYIDYGELGENVWGRFSRKELQPALFYQNIVFLDQIVQPNGFIYKDVVQPFVISVWLRPKEFRILRIKRDLADVAIAMLRQGWLYPSQASERKDDVELAMLEGLVLADQALSDLPALTLDYDDLIANSNTLWMALSRLYPERKFVPFDYINGEFRSRRAATLARRDTPEFGRIEEKIRQVRQKMGIGAGVPGSVV